MTYEQLIHDAVHTRFEGWDLGVFAGRYVEEPPSWDLREIVPARLGSTESLLDLGTGGGEFLSSLAPLPAVTAATEGYPPNVPVARRRLEPLGVHVADTTAEPDVLPFPDESFDLIVSRHEAYAPAEIRRVLRPGGLFITQQVGGRDLAEVNTALDAPPHAYRSWELAAAAADLERAGLTVSDGREELTPCTLHDVGAVVLLLRITPWHVPDFDVDTYDARLRELHKRLSAGTPLRAHCHRFLLTARRT